MPRPYRLGQRQAATEETRARILAAARELLTGTAGLGDFTIDAVARQAGVARMTVYYQFGSKVGLLEALCDTLARRGGLEQLGPAFAQPKARAALAEFIAVFGRFWASDRVLIRRLGALSVLDPDIEQTLVGRNERRREGARVLIRRLREESGRPGPDNFDETVEVLLALTSFHTFDSIAGTTRSPEEVVPLVRRLVFAALGLKPR
jgi:AcrR family transcriptional regulator